MSKSTEREERIDHLVKKLQANDAQTLDYVEDLLLFGLYGQDVLSQFGLGLKGFVFRQSRTNVLMTVKAVEGGVPLVAFITAATTMGCIEQMFDLLYNSRLKWQKDRYPWV